MAIRGHAPLPVHPVSPQSEVTTAALSSLLQLQQGHRGLGTLMPHGGQQVPIGCNRVSYAPSTSISLGGKAQQLTCINFNTLMSPSRSEPALSGLSAILGMVFLIVQMYGERRLPG